MIKLSTEEIVAILDKHSPKYDFDKVEAAKELHATLYPESKGNMTIDFNNLRMQTAYALDDVTKKLNAAIFKSGGYVNVGDEWINADPVLVIDPDDLVLKMNELHQHVWFLLCCFEEGNPDYRTVYEEVEANGGLSIFYDTGQDNDG